MDAVLWEWPLILQQQALSEIWLKSANGLLETKPTARLRTPRKNYFIEYADLCTGS